jgi:transposase-like protein
MDDENQEERKARRRWTGAQKQAMLAAYAASGQTQAAFCHEHGVAVPPFSTWRRRAPSTPGALIEVARPGGVAVTIPFADGVSLAVEAGTAVDWLARLVRALRCGG